MTSIVRLPLEKPVLDPWPDIVAAVAAWAAAQAVALRDAVLLVPFAQHLPLARRAFARAGGWMPRIETTMTLARSLAPPPELHPSQLRFDPALDRLAARRLLRGQPFGLALQRRDARGFDHAVRALVQTAHALARAAAAVPPEQREAHWAAGRGLLTVAGGPGGTERLLARVALEWAAASAEPATDLLFGLRPSAWIVVQAGGPQPLASALLAQEDGTPRLLLDTDAPPDDPLRGAAAGARIAVAACADFEAEAQRCAAEVLAHLASGQVPLVLVAQDRLLMRRVRALLARRQVPVSDETGWKLSTTRAGATIASLLRAAAPRAGNDDWLDWLKACVAAWPGLPDARAGLRALEGMLRRAAWSAPAQVDAAQLSEPAARLWSAAQAVIGDLRSPRTRPFAGWLAALRQALSACGAWEPLAADDAGRQALAALHLDDPAPAAPGEADTMTLPEFNAWLDDTLEEAAFVPEPPAGAPVVIAPLAHALLRPFAAVVLPGADEKRLGAQPSPHPLLGEAQAQALGLPGAEDQRRAEMLAFAQLLRQPSITLLRRLDDGGEPLAPSPLLERLGLALRAAGQPLAPAADPFELQPVPPQPVPRPMPVAPDLLPARLSASACEALRSCPYRFFALRMLGLREADELDDEVEKRDYGNWLHRVLYRFHAEREAPSAAADEEARLRTTALAVREEMALDEASFLPYWATFGRFVPRYVQWLHARDAAGARWSGGERELKAEPPAWGGIAMEGVIDRIDRSGEATELFDYKTGSAEMLKKKVARPQEDTQLAFYAALLAQQPEARRGPLAAAYLPLDESEGIAAIAHEHVEETAVQLVAGLGRDLARIRAGAPLPALGEGVACTFCEARGLCRRDHWAVDE